MNNLPEEIKCSICSKMMKKSRLSIFHQYYMCQNNKCNDVIGLPLNQNKEKEAKESNNDFGSGSFKSQRNKD